MSEYRVTYEIDVNADSPIMAAKQVHAYMRSQASYRPILSVVDAGGFETVVDLSDKE